MPTRDREAVTTPPPDKQPAAETLRDIAEDISREFGSEFELDRRDLTNAIDLALRNERERAAKICEGLVTFTEDHGGQEPCKWCEALETAAKTIREGTTFTRTKQ